MSDEQRDRRDGERAGYVAARPCEGAAQGAREVSAPAGAWFERPGGAYVMDTDTHNAIGYYRTEDAALSDVAEIVAEHGRDSAEARNLVMYCDGSGDSSIGGDALIARALDRARLTKSRPDH